MNQFPRLREQALLQCNHNPSILRAYVNNSSEFRLKLLLVRYAFCNVASATTDLVAYTRKIVTIGRVENMMLSPDVISEDDVDLAKLIIKTLNLDLDLAEITAETPIYQDGFGLDSIDILEVSLAISQRYGVKLRSDDKNNAEIFKNLGTLSAYIQSQKAGR